MARVTWTKAAQDNVHAIQRYIARDNPTAAAAMVRRIRAEGRRLAQYPEIGRAVADFDNPSFREVIVAPYRVIYRYHADQDRIDVVGVIHGNQLLPSYPDE